MSEEYVYEKSLLEKLDYSKCKSLTKRKLSYHNPGANLVMRPLLASDYDKGYMQLLSQLTSPGEVTRRMFNERFAEMRACNNTYLVTVIEDRTLDRIVGSATLLVETLISRDLTIVRKGRIEDVVVHESQRGKQLGKLICETLILLARETNCDEVTLECKDPLVKFYRMVGFTLERSSKYMTIRFS